VSDGTEQFRFIGDAFIHITLRRADLNRDRTDGWRIPIDDSCPKCAILGCSTKRLIGPWGGQFVKQRDLDRAMISSTTLICQITSGRTGVEFATSGIGLESNSCAVGSTDKPANTSAHRPEAGSRSISRAALRGKSDGNTAIPRRRMSVAMVRNMAAIRPRIKERLIVPGSVSSRYPSPRTANDIVVHDRFAVIPLITTPMMRTTIGVAFIDMVGKSMRLDQ